MINFLLLLVYKDWFLKLTQGTPNDRRRRTMMKSTSKEDQ